MAASQWRKPACRYLEPPLTVSATARVQPRDTCWALTLALVLTPLGVGAQESRLTVVELPSQTLTPLLLEVRLDGQLLTDSLTAYGLGDDSLLPLGELARLLTLGITVNSRTREVAGFVLAESRGFQLDAVRATLDSGNGPQAFDPALMRWREDDAYVSLGLLQQWWPIDFSVNLSSLTLTVRPREKLPLQYRLDRQRQAAQLDSAASGYQDPNYPRQLPSYQLISPPAVDQTLGLDVSRALGSNKTTAAYTTFVSADLVGMEASLFITSTSANPALDSRLTLSRNDPEAVLLGPLAARSIAVGNLALPSLSNVVRGSGNGLLISNRPLSQPSTYGTRTLRGNLPPGWDVTLFFNDALLGFQSSRPDGQYVFEDQQLVFGSNDFRLVFNGPMGQNRVERQVFMFDQTLTKPGEFYYTLGALQSPEGSKRQTLQIDLGLLESVALTGGISGIENFNWSEPSPPRLRQNYINIGLRTSTSGAIFTADHIVGSLGGTLNEWSVRTRIGQFSTDFSHTLLHEFTSDFFQTDADPVRTRDRARLSGSLALGDSWRLPVGVDLYKEQSVSGRRTDNALARVSLSLMGTSLTNTVNLQGGDVANTANGTLQVSRRVADIGLSSQLAYTVKPSTSISSLAVSADKTLSERSRVNFGFLRQPGFQETIFAGGYSHNFGGFTVSLSARWSQAREFALGMQLFTSLGRNPRSGHWLADWQPMAGTGVISARAFVDANMNGRFDDGEQPIENAGFVVNGSHHHPVKTGADGMAYLSRLQPKQYVDIGLDPATLEDPQWVPTAPGLRTLPRPGKVQMIDFPVLMTGEIDGTVYLLDGERQRGIGNAEVELINASGQLSGTASSGSDGYYILQAVKPGRYTVRVAPAQIHQLALMPSTERHVEVDALGDFVHGLDFELRRP